MFSISSITAQELHDKITVEGTTRIVDVRSPEEFADGHIPNAINIPSNEIQARIKEFESDSPVYVVCASGSRSMLATAFCVRAGMKHVVNVKGGTSAWQTAGFPLEQ